VRQKIHVYMLAHWSAQEFLYYDSNQFTNKYKETHLLNCSPTGPISSTCVARPSPELSWGWRRLPSLCRRAMRQVMRVGMQAASGGTRMRRPWRRRALTAAPRASTMKLIRNLPH